MELKDVKAYYINTGIESVKAGDYIDEEYFTKKAYIVKHKESDIYYSLNGTYIMSNEYDPTFYFVKELAEQVLESTNYKDLVIVETTISEFYNMEVCL